MTAQLTLDGTPWEPERPTPYTDADLVLAWLEVQPCGAWSRAQLSRASGLSDRRVRRAIEALRRAGWPVCSNSRQAGYWLSTDPAEVAAFVAELRSRIREQTETARALERTRERLAA